MQDQSAIKTTQDGADLYHACPSSPECPHCQNRAADEWNFLDAVYCISLKEREDRAENAAQELHRTGLCRKAIFYRPSRPARGMISVAIWESHKAVTRHALAHGYRNALILEDDVTFPTPQKLAARTRRAFQVLPPGWGGLFLGHWPVDGFFVSPSLMKVHSGCAHAYLASAALLRQITDSAPPPKGETCHPIVGRGIDGMLACRDDMYAIFPMLALQAPFTSDNVSLHLSRAGKKRPVTDIFRYRALVIIHGMRAAELLCVLLSPFHWVRSRLGKLAVSK